MSEEETIGQDVLGSGPPSSRMSEKKRKELRKQLAEEIRKKKEEERRKREEEEKLPKAPIPGEFPGDLTPEQRAELEQRARLTGKMLEDEEKTVDVKKHKRRPPKKEKKFEEIF